MTFYDLDLDDRLLDGLDAMNFRKPSPVQEAAIPPILEGHDIIACAQTGTGKTAAFVLPLLSLLCSDDYSEDHINVVIMAPTRELAQQIDQQIEAFSYFLPSISVTPIYGGTGGSEWEQQKRAMRLGTDIIVATPGRLTSHINLHTVDLSQVSFFVLDEADRMLDMGFYEDIIRIHNYLPESVQTIMFSATMPDNIRKMAKEILRNPKEVNIAISRPPKSINQTVYYSTEDDKLALLVQLLFARKPKRCIVFFSSKEMVRNTYRDLRSRGLKVAEMHSDLDQAHRDETMNAFKNGGIEILLATNIVSRGIDVEDIELIINFDVPHDPEDYVHRIGRTSRGTNLHGAATTLVSERDKRYFENIEKFLDYKVDPVDLPQGIRPMRENYREAGRGNRRQGGGKGSRRNNGRNTGHARSSIGMRSQKADEQKNSDNGNTPRQRNNRGRNDRRKNKNKNRGNASTNNNNTTQQ